MGNTCEELTSAILFTPWLDHNELSASPGPPVFQAICPFAGNIQKGVTGDFPDSPVVRTVLPLQETRVQFLVGELRSHKPHGTAKEEVTDLKPRHIRFCAQTHGGWPFFGMPRWGTSTSQMWVGEEMGRNSERWAWQESPDWFLCQQGGKNWGWGFQHAVLCAVTAEDSTERLWL